MLIILGNILIFAGLIRVFRSDIEIQAGQYERVSSEFYWIAPYSGIYTTKNGKQIHVEFSGAKFPRSLLGIDKNEEPVFGVRN